MGDLVIRWKGKDIVLDEDELAAFIESHTSSVPLLAQAGHGDPTGTVTPTAKGYIYQDVDSGGVYVAIGSTSEHWRMIGGFKAATNATVYDFENGLIYGSALGVGPIGNGIQIVITDDGPSSSFSISIVDHVITVHLATDESDTVTTTIGEMIAALTSSDAVMALINLETTPSCDPSLPAVESSWTLSGGTSDFTLYGYGDGLVVHGAGGIVVNGVAGITTQLASISCDGYGMYIDGHGTVILANESTHPGLQAYVNDGVDVGMQLNGDGVVLLPLMPTSDPGIAGALYSIAGVVHVSAG